MSTEKRIDWDEITAAITAFDNTGLGKAISVLAHLAATRVADLERKVAELEATTRDGIPGSHRVEMELVVSDYDAMLEPDDIVFMREPFASTAEVAEYLRIATVEVGRRAKAHGWRTDKRGRIKYYSTVDIVRTQIGAT